MGGSGSCARASRRSTRDDHRGRPGSRAEESPPRLLLLLARPVARVGVGERTADWLDVAGYAAVQGIRAAAGVAGADQADGTQAAAGHAYPRGRERGEKGGRRDSEGRKRAPVLERAV